MVEFVTRGSACRELGNLRVTGGLPRAADVVVITELSI